MLAEAVTCMCVGQDSKSIIVGMNESKIAMVNAGRSHLEVLGTISLATSVKTFYSISKTGRGDYAIGTSTGICFVKWLPYEKKFEVIRSTPTSTSGPPLSLLNNRQTLC